MDIVILVAKLFYFFLPAGLANMSPVLFKNRLKFLAKPVDLNVQLGGNPIFGSHKTWRGLIVAIMMGGFLYLLWLSIAYWYPESVAWSPFDITTLPWWFGFAFSAGAIGGDLVKSFFKRRVAIQPGKTWFPFDQIDFLIGAAFVASFFVHFTFLMWVIIISVGIVMHIFVNHIAFWLKVKDSPW